MKQNSSSFVNNLYYAKWMRMLLMSFMLLLSSSLFATTFYIKGSSWLKLSDSYIAMSASGSSHTYTFTSENTGVEQWFRICKDKQSDDNNYMLCYNGSDKNNLPLNNPISCSIGCWSELKMSVEKGVIYNITVTYTSNSDVKLLITATEPIVITPNKEAPYYLKDQITLTAKGGKGGSGDYEWYKKEPSDSDYTQIAGAYNATYSFTLDGSYIYKVVDTTTGVESTIDIKPSVRCDEANTKVIFSEDFGWLDSKERAESDYAKYTPKAACTSIKNGGEYAIVAVPVWGGCNVKDGADYDNSCYCPAYKSPEERGNINMWFNEKLDHATEDSYLKALKESHPLYSEEEIQKALEAFRTDFATNESVRQTYSVAPQSAKDNNKLYGGMLLFNCKGGSDDILYERKIDVCDNTYINFSAWFTKANVSNADKIGAKFVLLNGSTRGELDSYTVENIDVNAGWKQVSAMFNSKNCGGSVIVQLINYAPAGDNGNDLLVDDISLSICTPEASLHADYAGKQTDNVQAMIGEDINLISEIDNVIFSGSPFYWWQKKEVGSTSWTPLTSEPIQNKETYQVKVSDKKTEYRVIVANTKQAAKDAANDLNSDELCGLYSVTTSVLVEPILLSITPSVSNASICSDGTNTYTLTAENTSSVAINDVYAQVIIPEGLEAYKYGTETAFDGKWHIGNLAANTGKAELKLTLKSTTKVTDITSLSIKAYICAIGTNSSWSSYTEATIKKEISFNLKPLPGKPTFVSKSYYEECALTGSNTNVYFNTLIKGTGLKVYSNKELTNAVEYFAGATPTTKQVYYANQTIDGCTGDTVQFPVTVRQLPVLTSISVDDDAICTGGSTNINYTIDGGVGQYTLTMQSEMNNATQTFDKANLGTKDESGVESSFAVTPTSKAIFSFTQVKDAYCTNTVDASVILPVTVDVKSINIDTDVKDTTICSDTKANLKVKATGDDLQYQWYESTDGGNNYTAVGENQATYTTNPLIKAVDKNYRYKVTVSQSSGVCKPINGNPATVTVNDCSEFSMQYVPTKNEICQGATIDLAFSLENTSTTMAQTGVEVTITGLAPYIADQVNDLPSSAQIVNNDIVWTLGDLAIKEAKSIHITFTGTTAGVVESKAYVSKSGSNTYTEADQKALVPQTITVKAISRNPIVTPYASCPITGSINLVEDYVTLKDEAGNVLTDESGVKFYTLDDATGNYTQITGQFNTGNDSNENVEETFYVSNQNTGECESEKVALTATVYPPVKATISGDDIICNSENAYLAIKIPSGKPNFIIKYKVETDKEGPVEKKLTDLADREFSIPVWPTAKTVYTLTYVEDANKCKADLSKSGSATVEVNNKPSFTLVETTLGDLCAGTALELPTITVDDGGTAITQQGWYLAGQAITSIDELSIESHNGKKLTYKATNQCGTEEKTYTTLSVVDCADFTLTYSLSNANPCAGDTITLTATITNDGDASLSDVKLWQTWSNKQGAVNGKNPQSTFSVGSDYNNNEWVIDKFDSHTTHTLELTFIAQANEDFYMHVTESNGISYDSWENSPAKDKTSLTVKPISDDVQLNDLVGENATYKTCALDATSTQTLSLSSLVASDKTALQYYTMDDAGELVALTSEPIIALNQASGPKDYYIINTEDGKCPSDKPTKVTVQVLAKPTISISETSVTLNCSNSTQEVTVSGAATYEWINAQGNKTTGDELNLSRENVPSRTYTVVGYSADNCESDALTLTVTEDFVAPDAKISMPSGSYAINDSTLTCTLTSLELTASSTVSGVTYLWNDKNASTTNSITVEDANIYQVTVTNPNNGCSASAVKTILSNTKDPILSVSVLDAAGKPATALTCAADQDTLSLVPSVSNATEIGDKNITYTWSTNVIEVDNTTHAATVDKKATYRVTVVGDNGCSVYEDVTIDADQTKPVLSIASSNDTLTCLLPDAKLTATVSNVAMQSYSWTKKDDAGLSNVGSDAVITVSDSAMYIVTATAVNGCVEKDTIVVPQRTNLPKVEIASTDSVQYCRVNTLTASGALTYQWSTGSDDASIEVSEAGTYTVTGTNQYGCAKDTSIVLKDRKILPTIKLTTDTTTITCKKPDVTISSEITNKIEDRTYSYVWKNEAGTVVGNGTSKAVSDDKKYTVFVTDKVSDCVGEASKKLSVNKQEPKVDVKPLPAVCLPANIELTDAIGDNTLADKVVFYADEALTQEITETSFDVAQYDVYYVQGQQVDNNGCMGTAQPVAVNLKPATPAPVVKDYDECVKAESETFSPLVTSDSYKLTFYDVAQGGTPIADAFDASKANTTTTYYVTNTNQGACESERTAFTVHIEGLVDFDLTISDEEVMMGGEDVVITLIPAEVEVESYKWMANDKVLDVEGDEYVTKPYVDTKYVVAAKGRCNTLTQEVDVVVIWPTAFTPYNNNGLNETFAKGFEVKIYNRHGIQIFEGSDGWDGVMNQNMGQNVMAVPGVYYYAVPLPDGNVKKGTIEIVKF